MNYFDDKEEKEDFFDGPDIPDTPEPPKQPEKTALSPDDPDYWDEPESEWEHLEGGRNWRLWATICGVIAALILIVWGYIYIFTPSVDQATQFGYIDNIERHRNLLNSYEGVLIPFKEYHDTTRMYTRDFTFSTDNANAIRLRKMMYSGIPVRVEYKRYRVALPWRGESKTIVTGVDTANAADIIPYYPLPSHFSNSDDKSNN